MNSCSTIYLGDNEHSYGARQMVAQRNAIELASGELAGATGIAGRPRVFVSSTIYDLHDLRSALKWWLEQMGCEVRMSEFTDFRRPPDQGALNSCFAAIKDCHFYVLLVGGRRGTWYDQDNLVSVTRQEFRIAANLAKAGSLVPVVFIRSEVLTALREWRLRHKQAASRVPTKRRRTAALEDPGFTDVFISEINSTLYGPLVATGTEDKIFYYEFTEFDDLIPALRINLRLHASIRRQAMLANLRWELVENVSVLCTKHKGAPQPLNNWVAWIRGRVKLTVETLEENVRLPRRRALGVAMLWRFPPSPDRIRTAALQEAIASGEFLEFDSASGQLKGDPVYVAMQTLFAQIDLLRRRSRMSREREPKLLAIESALRAKQQNFEISAGDLLSLFALHDTIEDVLRLAIALLRYIMDPSARFRPPALSPLTPLADQEVSIEAERATHDDVEQWAVDGTLWGWVTSDSVSTDDTNARLDRYPWLREILAEEAKEIADEFNRRLEADGYERAMEWFQSGAWKQRD